MNVYQQKIMNRNQTQNILIKISYEYFSMLINISNLMKGKKISQQIGQWTRAISAINIHNNKA